MSRYTVEPEVAGGLGAGTVMDASVHPPRIDRLDHEFAGWLGDELLEVFPCYVVTDHLAEALRAADLTGFSLDDLVVSTTPEFADNHPGPLPRFWWLKVDGRPGVDDMVLDDQHVLTVSDEALAVLRTARIENAVVEPVPSGRTA